MPVTISGDGGLAGISNIGFSNMENVGTFTTSGGSATICPVNNTRSAIFVDNAVNRVGINTNAPAANSNLDISNAGEVRLQLTRTDGGIAQVGHDGTAAYVGTASNTQLRLFTNNATRLTAAAGGNIGIGTTAPADQLHINNDDSNSFATLRLEGSNRGGQLSFYNGALPVGQIEADQSGNIFFRSSLGFGNATLTGVAAISSSGRVGIGTSNPDVPLHILADNGIWCQDSANNDLVELRAKNDRAQIGFYNQDDVTDPLPLVFTQYITERMRINTAGNLAFPNGGGIDFSAAQGAGAANSLLDDYEEGQYTFALFDFPTGGNQSPSTIQAQYTKIGNLVFVTVPNFNNINTNGMNQGNDLNFSLPFASSATGNGAIGMPLFISQTIFQAGVSYYAPRVDANSNRGFFTGVRDGNSAINMAVSTINSGTSDFGRLTIVYQAA